MPMHVQKVMINPNKYNTLLKYQFMYTDDVTFKTCTCIINKVNRNMYLYVYSAQCLIYYRTQSAQG